jgi:hypothetical protein
MYSPRPNDKQNLDWIASTNSSEAELSSSSTLDMQLDIALIVDSRRSVVGGKRGFFNIAPSPILGPIADDQIPARTGKGATSFISQLPVALTNELTNRSKDHSKFE